MIVYEVTNGINFSMLYKSKRKAQNAVRRMGKVGMFKLYIIEREVQE